MKKKDKKKEEEVSQPKWRRIDDVRGQNTSVKERLDEQKDNFY